MPTITYVFDADAPREGRDHASEQMFLANRYRNTLCAIERKRRGDSEALLRLRCPELVEADARVIEAQEALDALLRLGKQTNARSRSRTSADDEGGKAAIKAARGVLKAARAAQKDLRHAAYADGSLKEELDAIDGASRIAAREARGQSSLYWANYQHTEEACSEFHKGAPPNFLRPDGTGTACVHFQGEPTYFGELLEGTSSARIERLEEGRALLYLRVGSEKLDGKRPSPIWTVTRFKPHREIPYNAKVSWVRLRRLRIGTEFRWFVQFVCETYEEEKTVSASTVGIDLGWRLIDGELRVACWHGSDGKSEEVCLPRELVSGDAVPSRLQSIRDRHFDGIKAVLLAWLRGDAIPSYVREHHLWLAEEIDRATLDIDCSGEKRWLKARRNALTHCQRELSAWRELAEKWNEPRTIPPGMLDEFAALHSWRSQGRLAMHLSTRPHVNPAVWRWAVERGREKGDKALCKGDEAIFGALLAWYSRDRHLCNWAAFQRRKTVRLRTDLYRKFVAGLARSYGVAFIEDTNWKDVVARPDVTERTEYGASEYARLAAVGNITKFLKEKMGVVKVSAENTTKTCCVCGKLCEWDQAKELRHTCEWCGAEWDQDENAAQVILARGEVAMVEQKAAREAKEAAGEEVTEVKARSSRRNRRSNRDRSQEGGQVVVG